MDLTMVVKSFSRANRLKKKREIEIINKNRLLYVSFIIMLYNEKNTVHGTEKEEHNEEYI